MVFLSLHKSVNNNFQNIMVWWFISMFLVVAKYSYLDLTRLRIKIGCNVIVLSKNEKYM